MENNNEFNQTEGQFTGTEQNAGSYQSGGAYSYPQQGGYESELEEPVSMGEWLIALLLVFFVPCVNIVLIFVWAFSKKEKKSKSNFFKAYLIVSIISLVVSTIAIIAFGASIIAAMGSLGTGMYY